MRTQIRLFFTALCFFTRLPFIRWSGSSEQDLNQSVRYFSLVGLIVGGIAAFSWWFCALFLPEPVAIIISMISSILVTGGFHEDGLADSCDGLGGGWTQEQMLTIMKDSRIGSYGSLSLIMALLLKFESLNAVTPALLPLIMVAGHGVSRLTSVSLIATLSYVKENGKAKPLAQKITKAELLIAGFFGLLPLAFLPIVFLPALIPVILSRVYFAYTLKRLIGGYTGDCLGAMQQIAELCFYLGILACSSI